MSTCRCFRRLRTRGSWVQVLPGAPDNQWLAAMRAIHLPTIATRLLLRGTYRRGAHRGHFVASTISRAVGVADVAPDELRQRATCLLERIGQHGMCGRT